jgi:MinD-like ATPase involved in chromosome partitioning or flagellar assembly
MMGSAQTLAIWGSPGAGKTVTAVKLALELATFKKNTIILMCDFAAPAPQTLQPKISTDGKSLGALLTLPSISQAAILAHSIPFSSSPYISLLGYQRGDNAFTYAQYSKERAIDLLTILGHLADYVLIDISSSFSFDTLSAAALENSDAVLRLCACDLKSMSYMSANLPLLADGRFNSGGHIKVLSAEKPGQDSGEYTNAYGGLTYTLPFVPELEEQYYTARLMEKLCSKAASRYNKVIRAITRDVLLDGSIEEPAGDRLHGDRVQGDMESTDEKKSFFKIKPRRDKKPLKEKKSQNNNTFFSRLGNFKKPEQKRISDNDQQCPKQGKARRLFAPKRPEIEDNGGISTLLRKGGKKTL